MLLEGGDDRNADALEAHTLTECGIQSLNINGTTLTVTGTSSSGTTNICHLTEQLILYRAGNSSIAGDQYITKIVFKNMRSLSSVDDSGNAVTGLGDFWNLETVELDSTVKFIESHVFDRASQLAAAGATDKFREINLTNVENIWYYAFAGCTKLTTINLQSISAVYQYAFSG